MEISNSQKLMNFLNKLTSQLPFRATMLSKEHIKLLKRNLFSRSSSNRKISSLLILLSSSFNNRNARTLEEENMLVCHKMYKGLSLGTRKTIIRQNSFKDILKKDPRFGKKETRSNRFFLKFFSYSSLETKIEILTLTEIRHFSQAGLFDRFPDPLSMCIWYLDQQMKGDEVDFSLRNLRIKHPSGPQSGSVGQRRRGFSLNQSSLKKNVKKLNVKRRKVGSRMKTEPDSKNGRAKIRHSRLKIPKRGDKWRSSDMSLNSAVTSSTDLWSIKKFRSSDISTNPSPESKSRSKMAPRHGRRGSFINRSFVLKRKRNSSGPRNESLFKRKNFIEKSIEFNDGSLNRKMKKSGFFFRIGKKVRTRNSMGRG